jgi:DNA modification methylase
MTDTFFDNGTVQLYKSDARSLPIPDTSVDCVVTSPPYWGLRDYGLDEQGLGLEPTPEEYCANMVAVFREVWRVLKPTGTVWLNLGDSYSSGSRTTTTNDTLRGDTTVNVTRTPVVKGIKPKDLVGIPWRVAFALQADGWYLRSDIIWSKPNPMPESVTDRPTKAHEYIFLLTKSPRYYYDADAIREAHVYPALNKAAQYGEGYRNKVNGKYTDAKMGGGGAGFKGHSGVYKADGTPLNNPLGRNKRSVWEITTQPYPEAHFATYPESLVSPCILAGTSEKGVCAECGKPWERTSVVTSVPDCETRDNRIGVIPGRNHASRMNSKGMEKVIRADTGWQPTCDCNADTVPATVLDPFAGSGTTLAVAQRVGRRGIGTDLSAEYLKLASKRIGKVSLPLF